MIWDYDPMCDSASCDFAVLGNTVSIGKKEFIQELQRMECTSLNVTSNTVEMSGVTTSVIPMHPMFPIPELNRIQDQEESSSSPEDDETVVSSTPLKLLRKASSFHILRGLTRKEHPSDSSKEKDSKDSSSVPISESKSLSLPSLKKPWSPPTLYRKKSTTTLGAPLPRKGSISVPQHRLSTIIEEANKSAVEEAEQRNGYNSVQLKNLILPDLDEHVWRETLAVRKEFQAVIKTSQSRFVDAFHTENSLVLQMSLEHSAQLYPLKAELLDEIEPLIERLDVIYNAWAEENKTIRERKYLYLYFQDLVHEAVKTQCGNRKPTEYESLEESEKQEKFKGNPYFFDHVNHKAYEVRMHEYLLRLHCLIKKSCEVALVAPSQEGKKLLNVLNLYVEIEPQYRSFNGEGSRELLLNLWTFIQKVEMYIASDKRMKEFLKLMLSSGNEKNSENNPFSDDMRDRLKEAERILDAQLLHNAITSFKQLLHENKELLRTMETMLRRVETKYIEVMRLEAIQDRKKQELQRQFEDGARIIDNYRSLQHIIAQSLYEHWAADEPRIIPIIAKISTAIIRTIDLECNKYDTDEYRSYFRLPQYFTAEKDLYVCPEWADDIYALISFSPSIKELKKHPGREKTLLNFSNELSRAIALNVAEKLKSLEAEKREAYEEQEHSEELALQANTLSI